MTWTKPLFIHTLPIYLNCMFESDIYDYIINLPQSKGLIQICQNGGKGGKYLKTGLEKVWIFTQIHQRVGIVWGYISIQNPCKTTNVSHILNEWKTSHLLFWLTFDRSPGGFYFKYNCITTTPIILRWCNRSSFSLELLKPSRVWAERDLITNTTTTSSGISQTYLRK